jgi:hypothetical protein
VPNTTPLVDSVSGFDAAAGRAKSIVDFSIEALAHASSLENIQRWPSAGRSPSSCFWTAGRRR